MGWQQTNKQTHSKNNAFKLNHKFTSMRKFHKTCREISG